MEKHGVSERRACKVIGQPRATQRYEPKNGDSGRYNIDQLELGGDSWATPELSGVLQNIEESSVDGFKVGDLSNMNGGLSPPHGSHKSGKDADFKVSDIEDPELSLNTVVNMIESDSRINLIFVCDSPNFTSRIKELRETNLAARRIVPERDHCSHFHLRIH